MFGNIVRFSLPYLFSYFLQTLYGMADLFIIGQFEDAAGTAAVSIGSQVMHMITVMTVGLAMGATVEIGQAVGAGNRKRARRNRQHRHAVRGCRHSAYSRFAAVRVSYSFGYVRSRRSR